MNYIGMECDYCHQRFQDGDDIVVCPDCGTPMHRSCWNKYGACVHADQHDTGFSWTSPEWEKQKADQQELEKTLKEVKDQLDQNQNPFGSSEYGGIRSYTTGANGEFHPTYRVIGPKEKLGDYTVEDYGKAVQKNKERYLPRFFAMQESGRKTSWNWAACFFPVIWAFYRKMYTVGIAMMVLISILPICFAKQIGQYYVEYSQDISSYLMSNANSTDEEQAEKDGTALAEKYQKKYGTAMTVLNINSYIVLLVSLLMGLFANYIYRIHCDKLLKKVKETISSDEEQNAFLKKHGGASWWSLLLGLLAQALLSWGIPLFGALL